MRLRSGPIPTTGKFATIRVGLIILCVGHLIFMGLYFVSGMDQLFRGIMESFCAWFLVIHEAFGAKGRGAKNEVLGHAYGDIAAVAVYVFSVPESAAHVAHALFDNQDFRGVEESVHFFLGFRIIVFPWENVVW